MTEQLQEAKWYVAHTYSGYENKVKTDLEQTVHNRGLEDLIQEVEVPLEECVEEKNGEQKNYFRKVFPGYVLVKMVMNNDTWYIVRNTRGVTGFVGPGSAPVALTPEEIMQLGISPTKYMITVSEGDSVQIMSGPFEGSVGNVTNVDQAQGLVTVMINIFGRDNPVELSFEQIKKIN